MYACIYAFRTFRVSCRQFYVQGRAHHSLHRWWHEPLQQLLRYWSLLESRTAVVVNTLQGAAEARFDQHPPGKKMARFLRGLP